MSDKEIVREEIEYNTELRQVMLVIHDGRGGTDRKCVPIESVLPKVTIESFTLVQKQKFTQGITGYMVDTRATPIKIAVHESECLPWEVQVVICYLVTGKIGWCSERRDIHRYEYLLYRLFKDKEIGPFTYRSIVPDGIGETVFDNGL